MTTIQNSDHTAELGVLALRKICARAKQICREVLFRDVGVDAFIELVDCGVAQGALIGAQVKAGASFVHGNRFAFTADAHHVRYWARCAFPMIAVIHDPATDRTAWLDVTGSCTPDRFTKDDFRFVADFSFQPLNEESLVQTVIPLARTYIGRVVGPRPELSFEPRPMETEFDAWLRLIGVLVAPASSNVEVADAARRLSWYMPLVTEAQRHAVVGVINKLTDFQLLKLVAAASDMLDCGGSDAEKILDLLAFNERSGRRLEELLRRNEVPDDLREAAVQLVECLSQRDRPDLRQDSPIGGAA